MKRFGFLNRAVEYLKEACMEVELFEGTEPDPSVETVMKGAEAMAQFEPDWIVAMGGGSPIDAANAILDACTGSNPRQPSQEEMEKLLKCCYYDTEVDF